MQPRKLLIAESSEEYRVALAESLTGEYHVRTCADGIQTQQLLRSFQPDILVLDLMLPGMDGITLLQLAREEGPLPMVLAQSRYISDYVLDALGEMGIAYVMSKPCTLRAAVARIRDMDRRECQRAGVQPRSPAEVTHPDPDAAVTNILLSLGFKANHDGCKYIREAVLIMLKMPDQRMTKELYPAVAEKFGCSGDNVERSGRTAVKYAFLHGDPQIWRLYFRPDKDGVLHRPTNGAFIARIAAVLREAENRRF